MYYDYVCLSSGAAHLSVGLPLIQQKIQRFPNGEIAVTVPHVAGASVLFLASMAGGELTANDHFVETLVTLRALRQAKHVTLGILYGAYTRQADGGQLMYDLLGDADAIWVLDPHVPPPSHIKTHTAGLIFARDMASRFVNPVVVAPDKGGVERASIVADYMQADLCVLSKSRGDDVRIAGMEGVSVAGRTCVIVDDIIDSGQTLMAAHTFLMGKGAREVHAYATHGLMSVRVAHNLFSKLDSLRVADSVACNALPVGWSVLPFWSSGHSQLGF